MNHNALPLDVVIRKNMSDNEIEDIQFLPGPSAGKRSVYEPKGLDKCKQVICSPTRAALIVTGGLAFIFLVALLASLARPPSSCRTEETSTSKGSTTTAPISTTNKTFPWSDIRLPTKVVPLTYDLFLHPDLTTFTFSGSVHITLDVKQATNFFLFHIKNLTLSSQKLFKRDVGTDSFSENLAIANILENTAHEQVYIETWDDLVPGQKYVLQLNFTGYISDNLAGFYRSSYTTPAKEKRWLAATHFEASDARAAFPCFDEPELKATFKMSMVRDDQHISLFNTKRITVEQFGEGSDLKVDKYAESVNMSTYLVAFVVCDYKALTDKTETGKDVSIYTPPYLLEEASLAMDVTPKILTFYEQFYNISYPLSKSDHIAVPDFAAGAMENWGLITYRMRSLLVNDTTASPGDKQWVVIVIAHELAHQWFGNLVTMKWWNDLWLNEGFASFMEYKGTDHVRPNWNMWDQFLTSTTWRAFSNDGLRSSHPISVDVRDPKEIEEIFDAISYDKGASVIRMCDFFLGEQPFRQGLQLYLDRHKFSNAETKDLWAALSEKSTDSGLDVAKVMDTWTGQMGYPVVTVKRTGNVITAIQERFLYNPRGETKEEYTSPYGYKWHIPLSFTTSTALYKSHQLIWMNMESASITLDDSPTWIKVNVNCTGLYRVHYDDDMWDALIKQLKDDHEVFSAADRASLIEDAFALARSGHLSIVKALELSTYLPNEKDHVPWSTALGVFRYIGHLIEDKADYVYLEEYLLSLIQTQLDMDVWRKVDDHLQKFLQSNILAEALHLHHTDSIQKAMAIFRDWMINGTEVPPTLKSLVYASGAKFGGQAEWDYLWQQYQHPDTPMEQKSYLRAMTATTDSVKIMRMLDWSMDVDKVRSADAVSVLQYLSGNSAGQVLTWDFVKKNWNVIFNRYKDMAFQMKHVIDVSRKFASNYAYNEVKQFFNDNLKGQDERSVSQALESIEMNIDWLKNNEKGLFDWLKKQSNEPN